MIVNPAFFFHLLSITSCWALIGRGDVRGSVLWCNGDFLANSAGTGLLVSNFMKGKNAAIVPVLCSSDLISTIISLGKGSFLFSFTHTKRNGKTNLPIEGWCQYCGPADSCASIGFAAGDEFFMLSCSRKYFKLANVLHFPLHVAYSNVIALIQ